MYVAMDALVELLKNMSNDLLSVFTYGSEYCLFN